MRTGAGSRASGLESFEDWRERVAQDVMWANRTIADHIPDFVPWSFAVPFGVLQLRARATTRARRGSSSGC